MASVASELSKTHISSTYRNQPDLRSILITISIRNDYWFLLMIKLIRIIECHLNEPQVSCENSNCKDPSSSDTRHIVCVEPFVLSDDLLSELLAFSIGFALGPFIVFL